MLVDVDVAVVVVELSAEGVGVGVVSLLSNLGGIVTTSPEGAGHSVSLLIFSASGKVSIDIFSGSSVHTVLFVLRDM